MPKEQSQIFSECSKTVSSPVRRLMSSATLKSCEVSLHHPGETRRVYTHRNPRWLYSGSNAQERRTWLGQKLADVESGDLNTRGQKFQSPMPPVQPQSYLLLIAGHLRLHRSTGEINKKDMKYPRKYQTHIETALYSTIKVCCDLVVWQEVDKNSQSTKTIFFFWGGGDKTLKMIWALRPLSKHAAPAIVP